MCVFKRALVPRTPLKGQCDSWEPLLFVVLTVHLIGSRPHTFEETTQFNIQLDPATCARPYAKHLHAIPD